MVRELLDRGITLREMFLFLVLLGLVFGVAFDAILSHFGA
jgi:hypothetical protein